MVDQLIRKIFNVQYSILNVQWEDFLLFRSGRGWKKGFAQRTQSNRERIDDFTKLFLYGKATVTDSVSPLALCETIPPACRML
jgi:hypothetical protein